MDRERARAFISANTRLLSPPLVPELSLHLAEESLPIWRKTEEELGEMNVPPPYWAFAWAGGQALARYVLDNPKTVAGKSLLDIGAGSGIAGIAARMAGARQAMANDIDVFSNEACCINAAANATSVDVSSDDLLASDPAAAVTGYQVIVLADVFYEREMAERMFALAKAARTSGALVLVGDPKRNYFPVERFEVLSEYRVPVTRELEDSEIKNAAVWRLASGG